MLNTLISWYIDKMIEENVISEIEQDQYEYHLLCIMESIAVIVALFIIGVFFHCVINVVIFILCFFMIRNRAGGYHLNSFRKCFIGTVMLEVLGIILIRYESLFMCKMLSVLSIVSYMVIMVYGTLNHPNIRFDKEEYRTSKIMSRMSSSMIMVLIFFLKWVNASAETIMFMEYAVTLAGFLLCLGKITKQYIIE